MFYTIIFIYLFKLHIRAAFIKLVNCILQTSNDQTVTQSSINTEHWSPNLNVWLIIWFGIATLRSLCMYFHENIKLFLLHYVLCRYINSGLKLYRAFPLPGILYFLYDVVNVEDVYLLLTACVVSIFLMHNVMENWIITNNPFYCSL